MSTNHTPKVSVIFPIYNNEKYIEKCIRSVMNQTLKDIEMILIDDGSTDPAPQIMDTLAKEDDRIRVVHKANEGVAIGENMGLDLARGEYVGFVEADDCIATDMYEQLYNRAIETDADIAKCGFYYSEKNSLHEFSAFFQLARDGEVFQAKDRPNIFMYHASMWAAIYKRSFINEHHLRNVITPSATYTDFTWSVMAYAYAKRITIVHKPLYYYTYDNPASSRVQEGEKCFYKPFHCLKANEILRNEGIFQEVKEEIGYQEFSTCLGHARRIKAELKDEYFKRFREVMLDVSKDGFGFKKFFFVDKYLAKLIVSNKKKQFYQYIGIMNLIMANRIVQLFWWDMKKLKFKIVR